MSPSWTAPARASRASRRSASSPAEGGPAPARACAPSSCRAMVAPGRRSRWARRSTRRPRASSSTPWRSASDERVRLVSRILPPAAAARVFAALAAGYVLSYGLRSVNAAIAPELVADLGLSNSALGGLTSAYFFAFAALQLPLGIWLDRYGSRRTNGVLLMVAALGCTIFALAESFAMLWIGRALIGAGVAGALMAAVRVYRFWFRPQLQQSLMAFMLVARSLGALAATGPVRMSLPVIGWRGVFLASAVLLVLAGIGILRLLPSDEPTVPRRPGEESIWRGYLVVFGEPWLWRFGVLALAAQSAFIAFQSLWTGPWFTEVLGMSPGSAAQALLAFNIVMMFGFLGVGWALPRLAAAGWEVPRLIVVATAI